MTTGCCFMACNQCCCKKRLARKYARKTPPSKLKKAHAWCLYITPVFIIGLCIAAHLGGSNHFSVGLASIQSGAIGFLDETTIVVTGVTPSLVDIIENLKTGVGGAIDTAVNAVNLGEIDTKVSPSLQTMCDGLELSQNNVDTIKRVSGELDASVVDLKDEADLLTTSNID